MSEFEEYRNKKIAKKRLEYGRKLGLSGEEIYVSDMVLDALCFFNPKIDGSYFDGDQSTEKLFNGDRALFEEFFCALVEKLDLKSVIEAAEIPAGREFETFPRFIQVAEFFYEVYFRKF